MVLDGKTKVIERLEGEKGLRSLLVNLVEIHRLNAVTGEISLFMAARTIAATTYVARDCYKSGLLTGRKENGRLLISSASLQKFGRRYITSRELTRRTGLRFSHDSPWVKIAGVKPVVVKGRLHKTIYRRAPIEAALPKIMAAAQAEAEKLSRVKWVGGEVLEILLKAERPVSAMDLYAMIGNDRMKLPTRNPITTFRKILWLNRDKIECIRKVGYWPKGRPLDRRTLSTLKVTTWKQIGLLVREHLAKSSRPVANAQLMTMLSKNGIKIWPTRAAIYLSRALRRHPEHIVYLRGHGYWLRNKAYKPANYRPDVAAAA
jgi:hypothetical protein